MKKLLKSEICGSVNSAHHALFIRKVKYFDSKKKKKKRRRRRRRRKKKKKHKTFVWKARKRTLKYCNSSPFIVSLKFNY